MHRNLSAIYAKSAAAFTAFVGADLFIDEVTIANADDWWQSMIADGLKQATIRKRVRTVKTLINWAIRRGYLIKSPVS
ncbi:MAG: phage integrase SAM-like domain-containing protein, partial [Planctomycetes bacterium]|nr:phage integrase SAM-like domain-containing protein [Planctomycetota bacterium]